MDKLRAFIGSYGGSRLAAALGVGRAAVSGWRHGRFIPSPEHCLAIERLSEGSVMAADIRPELFGPGAGYYYYETVD